MSEDNAPQAGPHSDGIREGHADPPVYYKVLYGGLVIWAVLFSGYFLLSGWSSAERFERKMAEHQEQVQSR